MNRIWCRLEDIADVHLGYKSLQNEFFYLTADVINEFGIEEEYLKEIYMLSDFSSQDFLQTPNKTTWLLYCKVRENDLRGTGVLKYIQTMANRPATLKKQGSGKQLTIKKVLEAQGGGLWYAPKATPHKAHIWLRKAFGGVFAPFLFKTPVVVDQRCNRIVPKQGFSWRDIASLMTTSLFALALEGDGASSMGGGALEWKTKSLRDARIIDLRKFSESERAILVELAETVWRDATPTDFSRDSQPADSIKALDEYVLKLVENPVTLEELYRDLHSTVKLRVQKAKTRKLSAKSQETADISEIATSIAASIRPFLEARRFPEDFQPFTNRSQYIGFNSTQELLLNAEPFMSVARVSVSDGAGNQLLEYNLPVHVAELTARTILFGRRNFSIPLDENVAIEKLKGFFSWIESIEREIAAGVAASALGTRYEEQLKEAILKELGISEVSYSAVVWGTHRLLPSKD